MRRSNYIIILISVSIILVVWYYTENSIVQKKKSMLSDLFSYGSLDFSTTDTILIYGCTDPKGLNYNDKATNSNDSCFYVEGCCDVSATNYNASADSCDVPNNNLIMCNYK
jgi:hypothetical protein